MDKSNETLADISNMLRKFSEAARAVNADLILDADDIADRIDSAAKRETVAGDAAKLREALEQIERMAQWGGSDFGNPVVRGLLDTLTSIRDKAKLALAAPPLPKQRRDRRKCVHFRFPSDEIDYAWCAKYGPHYECLGAHGCPNCREGDDHAKA